LNQILHKQEPAEVIVLVV